MKRSKTWKMALPVCAAFAASMVVASANPAPAAPNAQPDWCWATPKAHANPQPAARFSSVTSYPLSPGARAFALTVADLNGDGVPDAIVTGGGNVVSIFPGHKDGTFGPRTDLKMPALPYLNNFNVTTADFSGNGRPDILVSGGNPSGYVAIFHNNGDGTFNPKPTVYSVGYDPDIVKVADLRANGRLDIITGNNTASDVSVLLNNGDGTFSPERHYDVGPGPQGMTTAKLTGGHGHTDIITGNFGRVEDSVSVLKGRGDGTFRRARDYSAGTSINDVVVGDLANDGVQDIITADYVDQKIDVLMGNRCGGFHEPAKTYPIGPSVNRIALADLNGNGELDVVATVGPDSNRDPSEPPPPPGTKGSGVTVLLGNGDGTFAPRTTLANTGEEASVAVADVNGDGLPDILGVNYGNNSLDVWRNLGPQR